MNYRLLLVHAHPDDESSQSAATIMKYCSAGAQVTLVTCTLGEKGEILLPEFSHLSPSELGRHRANELRAATGLLGLDDLVFLGGPGRYHDSGMTTDEAGRVMAPETLPDNAFWKADLLEAADHLVAIIRDRRPHVISTYNPHGGYGHPDHIQAHRVTMYAVTLAAVAEHREDLGPAWRVPRVLWSVYNTGAWERGYEMADERFPGLFDERHARRLSKVTPKEAIVAVIPYADNADRARAALGAHASQVNLSDPFWQVHQLVNRLDGGGDAYVFVSGTPLPDDGAPHPCIFTGLDEDTQPL
ncbi:N-acetyl-1-D-myo-inositol-2-amino-2-deoxy-alpha-D-glucopyranoside deacetylase [Tessaracoccus sp. OH4464_COT-324]|uniref:N-acetyl-1-D-myo-inositol-2-amino-2-deoxy-alpha- D-glucopyranoside deacetylase n=1 Tax=Tessaracoccus sp. OH4464_COT-324 TaxID=2491059 RepID=UPI00131A15C0|nr:N-acetyl-1-D-myo-inositol-2-amino-2-deoxy-alpha-D-glucopyranoside deacetylase [Tessaracoccus sp. OH4464_COT-324]